MNKLWHKNHHSELHPHLERYTAGKDSHLDQEILPYDIRASQVHARMLHKIKILEEEEASRLVNKLEEFLFKALEGRFPISSQEEDGHTALENALTRELGQVGKKIHTGRSRNDQVLVALRLYMKDHLMQITNLLWILAQAFHKKAVQYEKTPLPGYSHTQQAMLSSVGHWLAAHLEGTLDDLDFVWSVAEHLDRNPLGSAAGFGVSLPLDREFTTEELGFSGIQFNSLYCQNSRGKFEGLYLESLCQIMHTLGRFASDLILYTSKEFDFFEVDLALTTGSSIMPQKRNLDGLEILRGQVKSVLMKKSLVMDLTTNLISGYHRDTQLIKEPLFEATNIVIQSLTTALLYASTVTPKEGVISSKISRDIFAADIANDLVQDQGVAFRDAYQQALKKLETTEINIEKNLASKISPGAPGNLELMFYQERLQAAVAMNKEYVPLLPDPFPLKGKQCPGCQKELSDEGWWITWDKSPLVGCDTCQGVIGFDSKAETLFFENL